MADGHRRLHLVSLLAITSVLVACSAPIVTARSERVLSEAPATPESSAAPAPTVQPTARPIPTPAVDSATDEPVEAPEPVSATERAELYAAIDIGCATDDRSLVADAIRDAAARDNNLPVLLLELLAVAEERPGLFAEKCAVVTSVFTESVSEDAPSVAQLSDECREIYATAASESQDLQDADSLISAALVLRGCPTVTQADYATASEPAPADSQPVGPILSERGVAGIAWGGSLTEAVATVTRHFGDGPEVQQSPVDNLWYYQWGDVALRSADQETLHSWISYDPSPGLPIDGIVGLTDDLTLDRPPAGLRSTWLPLRASDAMGTMSWVDSSVLILWLEAVVQDIDDPYPPDFDSMNPEFVAITSGEGFGWKSQGSAVVTGDRVDLRLAPSLEGRVVDQAVAGDEYTVLDSLVAGDGTWLAVAPLDPNRWSGWVPLESVEPLAP